MKPEIKIFKNNDAISEEIASMLLNLVKKSQDKNIHIALSGGSTPKAVFKYLTEKYGTKLNSKQFHFWWGDDRCVEPENNDSNYKWANNLWLRPIGISHKNIHRIYGENLPKDEAIRYSEEIKQHIPFANGLPQFDFMLLGLGEDGHTASIFPHQPELLSSDKICEVAFHPDSGQNRITITGRVINNSKLIVFLSTGANKAQKVKEIINGKLPNLPASHIIPANGKLVWLIDKDASSKLNDNF